MTNLFIFKIVHRVIGINHKVTSLPVLDKCSFFGEISLFQGTLEAIPLNKFKNPKILLSYININNDHREERCVHSDWSKITSYFAIITPRKVIVALFFQMTTTPFLDVSEEEINKLMENAVALIITCHE